MGSDQRPLNVVLLRAKAWLALVEKGMPDRGVEEAGVVWKLINNQHISHFRCISHHVFQKWKNPY